MKSSELKLEELINFGEGNHDFYGRRVVIHSLHAFANLRKDLLEMTNLEYTRRILTRFGYYWGQADAAAMKRVFEWHSFEEWMKAGCRLQAIQGVTRSVVKSLNVDETAGKFRMEVVWHNSGEAEENLIVFGKSSFPVCRMMTGYASGYASFCFGKDIYFIEEKCKAKGDRVCTAIGMDEKSWGSELKEFKHYFEPEDIQGKVTQLTRDLKKKSRELAKHRKQLKMMEQTIRPSMVEVRSKSYRSVLDLAGRVAPYDSSILITGESGVGKEVLARHIHNQSHRSKGPFVAVNCGALPETLLESELFGHKTGSFTGAVHDRIGLFEQAGKGTILLDEIGDVSPAMQIKLLRVLQEHEIMRVGESKTRKIDVRVIAATNQDLPRAVESGRFREDLYYRLRVIEIEIPPLRERTEDIIPLVRFFVQRLAEKTGQPDLRLDATCLDHLQRYSWPGNVRELENTIERAAVLCRNGVIFPEDLPDTVIESTVKRITTDPLKQTLAEFEMDHIREVMRIVDGNKSKAALILGISPATLWRKLKGKNNGP